MKLAALAAAASFFAPAIALACPAARSAAECGGCGSSFGSYFLATGVGLLAGVASVGLEGVARRRG